MNAKIAKLDELSQLIQDKDSLSQDLVSYFRLFGIRSILHRIGMNKSKGSSSYELIILLSIFRICGESIFTFHRNGFYGLCHFGKNCFYRLQNSPLMDWRRLLLSTARSFFALVRKSGAEPAEGPRMFILDDTTLEKTGKCMEFIGRVFDHTSHAYVLGYKLLSLSFFDGVSHIPLDFSIHAEKGKKGNYGMSATELSARYRKKRPSGSPGRSRGIEVAQSKLESALQMLKRAWKHGLRASYVVMDNWFDSHNLISAIRQVGNGGLHVICTVKKSRTRVFTVDGRKFNAAHIIASRERLHARTCRQYKCRYIRLDADFSGNPVRLFFIQCGKQGEWIVLLTTDRSLNFRKTFEYYQARWNVEVMYRECKQYLRLGKCQSNDFDAQIADATLAFMAYTMLSLKKRLCEYETFGELFRSLKKECMAMTLWQRVLRQVMEAFRRVTERTVHKKGSPQGKEGGSRSTFLEDLLNVYMADIMEVNDIKTVFRQKIST